MKTETTDMNRREFLSTTAAVGGAMVLGFWLPPEDAQAQAAVTADQAVRPEPWYRGVQGYRQAHMFRSPEESRLELGIIVHNLCNRSRYDAVIF